MWDWDRFGKDEFLGEVRLSAKLHFSYEWFILHDRVRGILFKHDKFIPGFKESLGHVILLVCTMIKFSRMIMLILCMGISWYQLTRRILAWLADWLNPKQT